MYYCPPCCWLLPPTHSVPCLLPTLIYQVSTVSTTSTIYPRNELYSTAYLQRIVERVRGCFIRVSIASVCLCISCCTFELRRYTGILHSWATSHVRTGPLGEQRCYVHRTSASSTLLERSLCEKDKHGHCSSFQKVNGRSPCRGSQGRSIRQSTR